MVGNGKTTEVPARMPAAGVVMPGAGLAMPRAGVVMRCADLVMMRAGLAMVCADLVMTRAGLVMLTADLAIRRAGLAIGAAGGWSFPAAVGRMGVRRGSVGVSGAVR